MTHQLIPLLKKELEAQKANLRKEDGITSIEVHETKTNEYINLGGYERATIAKDKAADFFFVVHFNASTSGRC